MPASPLLLLVAAIVAAAAVSHARRRRAIARAGDAGEQAVRRVLAEANLPFLQNLYIQPSDGATSSEIDFVFLLGGRLYVTEVKGWRGTITGHGDNSHWRQRKTSRRGYTHNNQVTNPQGQLRRHVKALFAERARAGIRRIDVTQLIVFPTSERVAVEGADNVLDLDGLRALVAEHRAWQVPWANERAFWDHLENHHVSSDAAASRQRHAERNNARAARLGAARRQLAADATAAAQWLRPYCARAGDGIRNAARTAGRRLARRETS